MAETAFVPEITSLKQVYPATSLDAQKQRWEHLLAKFEQHYGQPAEYISRSPGRVNIIGEHIDYSLFSVLPMAVEADLLLAFRIVPGSSTITLSNVLPKFPTRTFTVPAAGAGDLPIDATKLEWSNYFKSGYRGALEFLRSQHHPAAAAPPGLQILVDGNVPGGGGLSSSAAFVCASALAGMLSMGVTAVDKTSLVALAITSERYVGVNAGGMDQSASVFGEDGKALHISFDPTLSAAPVAFPKTSPEPVFLIANTFKTVEKHVTAPEQYNLRVVECTLAAEVLARLHNVAPLPADAGPLGSTLKGFMRRYLAAHPMPHAGLAETYEAMARVVRETLTEDDYTREDLARILGVAPDDLDRRYMTRFPIRAARFRLRARALHVFEEAARVERFVALLRECERAGNQDEEVLRRLGKLMDESQRSCRVLYECSAPELDELCAIAKECGSYGSRLTGAGWGGCSVHLVPEGRVREVKEAWMQRYYAGKGLSREQLEEAVVVTKPGQGSVWFRKVQDVPGIL